MLPGAVPVPSGSSESSLLNAANTSETGTPRTRSRSCLPAWHASVVSWLVVLSVSALLGWAMWSYY